MVLIFILMFGSSCEESYTPTPIPLTDSYDESHESPVLDVTTTRSSPESPEGHLQLPYFGHLSSTESLQPQSSVTDVVFLPGQVESGFQPMTGGVSEGYDSHVRRHDRAESYLQNYNLGYNQGYPHQPRYSPRPIRGPARTRHWSSPGPGRNSYRSSLQFKYSERNPAEDISRHPTPVSYGRLRQSSREKIRPEYRDSHFYRSQPESFNYESDKPEASRHISYYNDDISDIENSVLRELIFGEKL